MTIAGREVRWPVDVAVAAVVLVVTGMDAWWNQPGTRDADALTLYRAGTCRTHGELGFSGSR